MIWCNDVAVLCWTCLRWFGLPLEFILWFNRRILLLHCIATNQSDEAICFYMFLIIFYLSLDSLLGQPFPCLPLTVVSLTAVAKAAAQKQDVAVAQSPQHLCQDVQPSLQQILVTLLLGDSWPNSVHTYESYDRSM